MYLIMQHTQLYMTQMFYFFWWELCKIEFMRIPVFVRHIPVATLKQWAVSAFFRVLMYYKV